MIMMMIMMLMMMIMIVGSDHARYYYFETYFAKITRLSTTALIYPRMFTHIDKLHR